MQPTPKPKIETKNVKYTFSEGEKNQLGEKLAIAIGALRGVHSEFDQIKAHYKSQITAHESNIDALSTARVNGFDMRNCECVVIFRPKDKRKDYILKALWDGTERPDLIKWTPILTEDMTQADFQQELIEAESKFDKREEISIFEAGADKCSIVVGVFMGKWYSAVRLNVGKHVFSERLDSEAKAFKHRWDAINTAGKRLMDIIARVLPKDAKGFEEPLAKALEPHKERVE